MSDEPVDPFGQPDPAPDVDLQLDVETPSADPAEPEPVGPDAVTAADQATGGVAQVDDELDVDAVTAELDEIEHTLDRLSG